MDLIRATTDLQGAIDEGPPSLYRKALYWDVFEPLNRGGCVRG